MRLYVCTCVIDKRLVSLSNERKIMSGNGGGGDGGAIGRGGWIKKPYIDTTHNTLYPHRLIDSYTFNMGIPRDS